MTTQTVHYSRYEVDFVVPVPIPKAAGAGAPETVNQRQLRDGREALRDWLGSGRDALTASDSSLGKAVSQILTAMFPRRREGED